MPGLTRRDLLAAAGGWAVTAGLSFVRPASADLFETWFARQGREGVIRPPITPNDRFYLTSYRTPPDLRLEQWSLSVRGLVERPLALDYAQATARPAVSRIATLECIGNSVGDDTIGTAEWTGIPLKALLDEVGVRDGAVDVVFRAADGYTDSLSLERALSGDVLVAHRMNGVPLPRAHGFPLRVIAPGLYGMKSVQWLTEIDVVEQDYLGYYQTKGWSEAAIVKTMSRIDAPGHGETVRGLAQTVRGFAFAGSRGVQAVELSLDGGERWAPAQLEPELSPHAWRFWSFRWTVPKPGRWTLAVRAQDGQGRWQTSADEGPFPDGAQGLHEITVTVQS